MPDDLGEQGGATREPQGPQRSFVKETKEKVQAAKRAAKRVQTAVKTTVAVGRTIAAANPVTLGILAVVVIIILVLVFIMLGFITLKASGGGGKVDNESGGSIFSGLSFDNPEHRQLVEDVVKCTQGDNPVLFSDDLNLAQELTWFVDSNGNKHHKLDYRVVVTLRYLCHTWVAHGQGKIGINLLESNGPTDTRTGAKDESGEFKLTDSNSAYQYGQAIGIDAIGLTSPELTQALGLPAPIPVRVDWQLTTSEKLVRPLYEQIETDAAELYNIMASAFGQVVTNEPTDEFWQGLADAHQAVESSGDKDAFTLTLDRLGLLVVGLNKLKVVSGLDGRALNFANGALEKLMGPLVTLSALEQQGDGVALMKEWAKPETEKNLRDGIYYSFKAMQVANMVGWYGNIDRIYLWKAYEARMNIRQLELDLLRMPIELADAKDEDHFNSLFAVNQLVVYSPEDDLDNNLPDLDVYPRGAVSVNEGGVAFDVVPDGYVTFPDEHFSALPIDHGPFVKSCTTFIYKVKADNQAGIDQANNVLANLAPSASIEQMCNLLYGPTAYPKEESEASSGGAEGTSQLEGESSTAPQEPEEIEVVGRVTYQKFVHIAF